MSLVLAVTTNAHLVKFKPKLPFIWMDLLVFPHVQITTIQTQLQESVNNVLLIVLSVVLLLNALLVTLLRLCIILLKEHVDLNVQLIINLPD